MFYRSVNTIIASDDPRPVDVGLKGPSQFKNFEPARWPEGELISIAGEIWPAAENHMSHYKGWTIVIYRDRIDNDWGGQAVQSLCKELATFRQYNGSENIRSVIGSDFFPTKEEAFTNLKSMVDEEMKNTRPSSVS